MTSPSRDIPVPTGCFCQITMDELVPWARRRYLEGASTLQLLGLAGSAREREAVGIVALLDVPDEELVRILRPLRPSDCSVLACRDHVRRWLAELVRSRN